MTYDELVKSKLSEKRYKHTVAVARLAVELAQHYGCSTQDAQTAAMLHDITKEESLDTQLQIIDNSDIICSNICLSSKNVYHSITGYIYAKDVLKIENEDILNSILYHTTGRGDMSMLEKIVFTADTVAYDRDYDGVVRLRKLSFEDIDVCILEITSFIITDLVKKKAVIECDTIECYNALCGKLRSVEVNQ